jgi:ribosomal-protein-alanine N-acetyltransferase
MDDHEGATTGKRASSVRVGPADWRGLRALAAVQKASFRPGLAYGLSALAILKVFPGVVFLVAHTDAVQEAGSIIGDRHRGQLRIMNLAVDPSARRQGVASALLRSIETAVPTTDIVLMVEEWNTGAQMLYEIEGYSRNGTARDYYGKSRHGIRMRKHRGACGTSPTTRIRV